MKRKLIVTLCPLLLIVSSISLFAQDSIAEHELGKLQLNSKRDTLKVIEEWKKAADAGNADAMASLGWAYDWDFGVPVRSEAIAYDYYLKSAMLGNPVGKYRYAIALVCRGMGWRYVCGDYSEPAFRDYYVRQGVKMLQEVAAGTHREAAQEAAYYYGMVAYSADPDYPEDEYVKTVKRFFGDQENGKKWIGKAAEMGLEKAVSNMIAFSMESRKYEDAKKWIAKAEGDQVYCNKDIPKTDLLKAIDFLAANKEYCARAFVVRELGVSIVDIYSGKKKIYILADKDGEGCGVISLSKDNPWCSMTQFNYKGVWQEEDNNTIVCRPEKGDNYVIKVE